MSEKVLIRYNYPGTTNGKPVGEVYVTDVYGGGVNDIAFSHTYDPAKALRFTREQAADALSYRSWRHNNGRIVPLSEAVNLTPTNITQFNTEMA